MHGDEFKHESEVNLGCHSSRPSTLFLKCGLFLACSLLNVLTSKPPERACLWFPNTGVAITLLLKNMGSGAWIYAFLLMWRTLYQLRSLPGHIYVHFSCLRYHLLQSTITYPLWDRLAYSQGQPCPIPQGGSWGLNPQWAGYSEAWLWGV